MLTKADIPSYGDFHSGERIELPHGYSAVVKLLDDMDSDAPWERDDGRGPVTDWTTRDKLPGERVLCEDRRSKRFYDYATAICIAKRDGWDAKPYGQGTKGQRAVRAVEEDFEVLRRWCNDEWRYVGVVVALFDKDDCEVSSDALWGVESDGDYWREVAAENINILFAAELEQRSAAWRNALKEAREARYWAQRDTATVQHCGI